jgi:hypothetical protein
MGNPSAFCTPPKYFDNTRILLLSRGIIGDVEVKKWEKTKGNSESTQRRLTSRSAVQKKSKTKIIADKNSIVLMICKNNMAS